MLITRLDTLTSKIAELRGLEEAAKDAQAYATRAGQLQTQAAALTQLAILATEFRRRGIVIPLNGTKLSALAYQARTAHERFLEAHETIVGSTSGLAARFFEPLKDVASEIRSVLQQAWTDYVDSTLPTELQPELLDIFGRLPGFNEQVAYLSQLYREAAQLRGKLPQTAEEVDRIEILASELRSAWSTLPTRDMPRDVREFLEVAVGNGASLSQLTGSVVEWLCENNLDDRVRISLRAQTT